MCTLALSHYRILLFMPVEGNRPRCDLASVLIRYPALIQYETETSICGCFATCCIIAGFLCTWARSLSLLSLSLSELFVLYSTGLSYPLLFRRPPRSSPWPRPPNPISSRTKTFSSTLTTRKTIPGGSTLTTHETARLMLAASNPFPAPRAPIRPPQHPSGCSKHTHLRPFASKPPFLPTMCGDPLNSRGANEQTVR